MGSLLLRHEVDYPTHSIENPSMQLFRSYTGHSGGATAASTIRASDVRTLEDLTPLVADQKSGDGTQIRLSSGSWKVKPHPGARATYGARRHIEAANTSNAALFKQSLVRRGCQTVPADLIRIVRGAELSCLTVGQLKAELRAIRLFDQANLRGMKPDAALDLVKEAWLLSTGHGAINLDDDLPTLATIMSQAPSLSFQAALNVLRAEREGVTPDDFEVDPKAATVHVGSPTRSAKTVAGRSPQSASSASSSMPSPAASTLHPPASDAASQATTATAAFDQPLRVPVVVQGRDKPLSLHPAVAAWLASDWTVSDQTAFKWDILSKVLDETPGTLHAANIGAVVRSLKADTAIELSDLAVRSSIASLTALRALNSQMRS